MDTLESRIKKARKDHVCDACSWLLDRVNANAEDIVLDLDCTDEEKAALERAEANGWKVKKGDKYWYWKGVFDGQISESHSIPEIHEICIKYDIYDF